MKLISKLKFDYIRKPFLTICLLLSIVSFLLPIISINGHIYNGMDIIDLSRKGYSTIGLLRIFDITETIDSTVNILLQLIQNRLILIAVITLFTALLINVTYKYKQVIAITAVMVNFVIAAKLTFYVINAFDSLTDEVDKYFESRTIIGRFYDLSPEVIVRPGAGVYLWLGLQLIVLGASIISLIMICKKTKKFSLPQQNNEVI